MIARIESLAALLYWLEGLSDDDRAQLELKDRPKPAREV